ncbi:hypothetical protein [Tunicatimonas pelagia]|uniref:hypothetical protein n=1 Tax=Tunicatimonas pelagia TaxID=931531 RepID=UPI0026669903|nr:hypothetical protein [Tunicatimonas pelagia]WKN43756.1 hypothetical protein P0M28_02065 [Tunicatimonas pelagia]
MIKNKWLIIGQPSTIQLAAGLVFLFTTVAAQTEISVNEGAPRTIHADWVGANANLTAISQPGENDAFVKAVNQLGVRTIRYPGGTIGNYWDWDRGWLDPDVPDSLMIPWVVSHGLTRSDQRYTLEDLERLTRRTGTTPVFMLNMLSKDLEHSLRNLRKAQALGMTIKYVELGNELYFDLPLPNQKYPTPEIYGDSCQHWITAIKQEFPEAQCAVVGTYMTRHDRQINWTQRVLQHCPDADAVTFHRYSPSGLDGRRERARITAGTEGTGDRNTATRIGPTVRSDRQIWEREQLTDEAALANMLTTVQQSVQSYRKMKLPPGMPIWATEFNMRDDHSVVLHSWSHALVLSMYYLEFLHSPVTLTSVHNLVGQLFGQIHIDTATFSHLAEPKVASVPYTLTAGGIATSLLAQATQGATQATPLVIEGATTLQDDRGTTVTSVQGWMFANKEQHQALLLVNFGYKAQHMPYLTEWPQGTVTSYSANLAQPINGWESVLSQQQEVPDETLELPPHSISIITNSK